MVQQIDGRGDVQYRSADIVSFFGGRTRSIRPPKLDLQIQFSSDSSNLDDRAKRNIDEFARALDDPKLEGVRFKVAGHTDDTGSALHNLRLSRERADAVRSYLIERGGIDSARLEIEAHGENNPLIGGQDDYARQMNRRVEFTPARD
jgi:outer membrane protein OmpA-like peptidoglycan-associated protein